MNKNDENTKLDQILELLIEASTDREDKKKSKIDVEKYMNQFLSQAKKVQQEGVAKVKETAQTVNNHVHEKPWYYLAGAAIGGLLIGLICGRRS